jgi:hypothetical protein
VFGRVDLVYAAAKDCQGAPAGLQGGLVGNAIHAARQPADHGNALARQPGSHWKNAGRIHARAAPALTASMSQACM